MDFKKTQFFEDDNEAYEALQLLCDHFGFTLKENMTCEKHNGHTVQILFETSVMHAGTNVMSTLNDQTDFDPLSSNIWTEDFQLEDARIIAEHAALCCREILSKMLGRIVSLDYDRHEQVVIPNARSVEELKLKLELMS